MHEHVGTLKATAQLGTDLFQGQAGARSAAQASIAALGKACLLRQFRGGRSSLHSRLRTAFFGLLRPLFLFNMVSILRSGGRHPSRARDSGPFSSFSWGLTEMASFSPKCACLFSWFSGPVFSGFVASCHERSRRREGPCLPMHSVSYTSSDPHNPRRALMPFAFPSGCAAWGPCGAVCGPCPVARPRASPLP